MSTTFFYCTSVDVWPIVPQGVYSDNFITSITGTGSSTTASITVNNTTFLNGATKSFRFWARNLDELGSYPRSGSVELISAQGINRATFRVPSDSTFNSYSAIIYAVYGSNFTVEPFGHTVKTGTITKPVEQGYTLKRRARITFNALNTFVIPQTGVLVEYIFNARYTGTTVSRYQLYLSRGNSTFPLLQTPIKIPANCNFYNKRLSFAPGIGLYPGDKIFALPTVLDPQMTDPRMDLIFMNYTLGEPNA